MQLMRAKLNKDYSTATTTKHRLKNITMNKMDQTTAVLKQYTTALVWILLNE